MRTAHFFDRGLNPAPIDRLVLLALALAIGGFLRGLKFGPVAMRTDKAPSIVMDFLAVHGPSSLSKTGLNRAGCRSAMRQIKFRFGVKIGSPSLMTARAPNA